MVFESLPVPYRVGIFCRFAFVFGCSDQVYLAIFLGHQVFTLLHFCLQLAGLDFEPFYFLRRLD